jgi:hypothetical protein
MADRAVLEIVGLLSRLGKLVFVPLLVKPTRERFPLHADHPIEALKLFLYAYAFERQGRSPSYPEPAVRALEEASRRRLVSKGKLWEKFCELGSFHPDGEGAAPKNNPLWAGPPGDQSRNLVAVAFSKELEPDDHNLYRFARLGLESNQLSQAHTYLKQIRGTGPKIASLFLRDVALDQNLSDADPTDRDLLQPIDIWLRRTAARLAQNRFENDQADAQKVVCLADEASCCALSLNAGSWYFGSKIARTMQGLDEALKSPNLVRRLIEEHRERLHKEAKLLDRLDEQRVESRPERVREAAPMLAKTYAAFKAAGVDDNQAEAAAEELAAFETRFAAIESGISRIDGKMTAMKVG